MKNKSDYFKVNLIYFILVVVFVAVRILFSSGVFPDDESWVDSLGSSIIQIGIMFCLPLFLYMAFFKKKPRETFQDFRVHKINLNTVFISLGIGVCVYILTLGIAAIFSFLLTFIGYTKPITEGSKEVVTGWSFVLSILFTAILPGICEEFANRGLLLRGLNSSGAKRAILYSGLLFGLMHLNINQFFYATLIGCLLAAMVYLSGSIIPAMIVHFTNNFIGVYLSYCNELNLPFKKAINWASAFMSEGTFLSLAIVIIVFVAAGGLLVYLLKLLVKQTIGKRFEKMKGEIAKDYLEDCVLGETESPRVTDEALGLIYDEEVEVDGEKKIIRMKIPFEKLGVEAKKKIKPTHWENFFLYGSLFLGGLVTLYTLIWGMI